MCLSWMKQQKGSNGHSTGRRVGKSWNYRDAYAINYGDGDERSKVQYEETVTLISDKAKSI